MSEDNDNANGTKGTKDMRAGSDDKKKDKRAGSGNKKDNRA